MKMRDLLDEAVQATGLGGKTFYHGTSKVERAEAIMRDGIQPQAAASMGKKVRGSMTPVQGMIYATPNLRYALIYALGGSFVGQNPDPRITPENRYGYLFTIPGERIGMIQPDEDEIGQAIRDSYRMTTMRRENPNAVLTAEMSDNAPFGAALAQDPVLMNDLLDLAWRQLTPGQRDKLFRGYEYAIMAQAGKKLVKLMSPAMKLKLINMGCHVAHQGGIVPAECWRIDKTRSRELGLHGEHVFNIAEKMPYRG